MSEELGIVNQSENGWHWEQTEWRGVCGKTIPCSMIHINQQILQTTQWEAD